MVSFMYCLNFLDVGKMLLSYSLSSWKILNKKGKLSEKEFSIVREHSYVNGLQLIEKNNLKSEDIDWLVPHQANLRIIDATANRMGLTKEKVMINIEKYGNNARCITWLFLLFRNSLYKCKKINRY